MNVAAIIKENRDRKLRQAWDAVLRTPEGRLVIWSILEHCHLFSQTHAGDANDGFRAGMREVGLRVLNQQVFPHDVKTFAGMQVEHAEMTAETRGNFAASLYGNG
ncbi:hypothetical protein [Paracoccus sp. PAR01]|uniref:Bbp19 family protein n=1 Tax=Paracoccus sp. PAR01 TaxID=2769282 RepID=UPI00177FDA3D|nr:hypothetical protein [Paracoccus sp. PAR01]MBD9528243.1 hypothetical protein [Paracoccus sp. PAR01]